MNRNGVVKVLIAILCAMGACSAQSDVCRATDADANSIDSILQKLREKTSRLHSYQCNINYLFSQPLLESQTLKTGVLYYVKSAGGPAADQSKLRINFETLKQDDEPEKKYIEHYIFDGQWLTQIDYQIKQVKRRQLAEPNEPIDAFELARRNFPIIGFTKTEDLKEQFEITLAEPNKNEPAELVLLRLKVKPDSIYKDDYKTVDFWIDKRLSLPAKIIAVSTEEDIYQIDLTGAKADEPIDKKVFDFTIPDGFSEPEVIPLRKESK